MSEKTFFFNAARGNMTLKDIFSDVRRHHTPDEVARVFISGTSLTTPSEAEMLAGWQKPFLFARFFLAAALTMLVVLGMPLLGNHRGYDVVLIVLSMIVPFSVLLLTWEMNIPRSISLVEVLRIVALGGALSLVFTILFEMFNPLEGPQWAPVTEEPAKLAIILLLLKKKNYKYITEGILLGMAVGTGFAIMETLSYVMDNMRGAMVSATLEYINLVIEMRSKGYDFTTIGMVLFRERGIWQGLYVAALRAVNAVAGHGMLAAFYGGGIMIAKGREPFRMHHLTNGYFLKYFGISFLLHFLNNLELTGKIFPMIGPIWSYSIVQTVVAVSLFLPLLRQGVNQVVATTLQYNSGQLTMAVERMDSVMPRHQSQGYYPQPQLPTPYPQPQPQLQYSPTRHLQPASAVIQFLSGPNAGKCYRVSPGKPVTLGRTPGQCNLAMPSCNRVSGRHCSLELRDRTVVVTDLSSTNGTYTENRRLPANMPTAVTNGTVVYLGNQNCAFRVMIQ